MRHLLLHWQLVSTRQSRHSHLHERHVVGSSAAREYRGTGLTRGCRICSALTACVAGRRLGFACLLLAPAALRLVSTRRSRHSHLHCQYGRRSRVQGNQRSSSAASVSTRQSRHSHLHERRLLACLLAPCLFNQPHMQCADCVMCCRPPARQPARSGLAAALAVRPQVASARQPAQSAAREYEAIEPLAPA